VHTRIPWRARSRAIGSVNAHHAAFRSGISGLPDLPSKAAIDAVFAIATALATRVGRVA